jgi:hypothetical protein
MGTIWQKRRLLIFAGPAVLLLAIFLAWRQGARTDLLASRQAEIRDIVSQDFTQITDSFYRPKIYRHALLANLSGTDPAAKHEEVMLIVTSEGDIGFATWVNGPAVFKIIVEDKVYNAPCGRVRPGANGGVELLNLDFSLRRDTAGLLPALTFDKTSTTYLFRLGKDDERTIGPQQVEAMRKSLRLAELLKLVSQESH